MNIWFRQLVFWKIWALEVLCDLTTLCKTFGIHPEQLFKCIHTMRHIHTERAVAAGAPPQSTAGVGFTAQGFDACVDYEILPAAVSKPPDANDGSLLRFLCLLSMLYRFDLPWLILVSIAGSDRALPTIDS